MCTRPSLAALLAGFGLAACSSPPPADPPPGTVQYVKMGPVAKQVCTRERPTGSNREVMVCRDYLIAEKHAREQRMQMQHAPRGGMPKVD